MPGVPHPLRESLEFGLAEMTDILISGLGLPFLGDLGSTELVWTPKVHTFKQSPDSNAKLQVPPADSLYFDRLGGAQEAECFWIHPGDPGYCLLIVLREALLPANVQVRPSCSWSLFSLAL